MSVAPLLERIGHAVEALRSSFGDLGEKLYEHEDRTQYVFETDRIDVSWLSDTFPNLTKVLLAANFEVNLQVTVYDLAAVLDVRLSSDRQLQLMCGQVNERDEELPNLTTPALKAVEVMQKSLQVGSTATLDELLAKIGHVLEQQTPVALALRVYLNKSVICATFLSTGAQSYITHTFLFPERLATLLEEITLTSLESQYFAHGRKTLIVVFGWEGCLAGELLSVFGKDRAADIDTYLAQSMSADQIRRVEETLDFRDWHCVWPDQTSWLVPDTFSLTPQFDEKDKVASNLLSQVNSFQVLLAIAFLADRTRLVQDGKQVEVLFSGQQRTSLRFGRTDIRQYSPYFRGIYALYQFAYDGRSGDKIAIVRQFLALSVSDVASLFHKASQALEASAKTHDRYLQDRVAEYFEAKRTTQNYIQKVVSATEEATLKLTGDVAENVYKTVGVIAAAAVATVLDPKLTELAAFLAALVLSIYLGLILRYYMDAVWEARRIREHEYVDHINSFRDVLGDEMTRALVRNRHVSEARKLFVRKAKWATVFYITLLVVATLVALYYLIRLL